MKSLFDDDPVYLAWAYWFQSVCSFSSMPGRGFAISANGGGGMPSVVINHREEITKAMAEKLEAVTLTCRDFSENSRTTITPPLGRVQF